jgi:DNA processing protein
LGASQVLSELLSAKSPVKNVSAIASRLAHYRAAAEGLAGKLNDGKELDVRFVTPLDLDWPNKLRALGAREPLGLFACGALNISAALETSISIVGTRSATAYGRYIAADIAAELASNGFTVVSGAAFGIDSAAHEAALAVGGPTVAVMPAWVCDDYPPSNASLLAQIRHAGLALSELPIGTHATRPRFLQRNRVIAALSVATLVIEAPWRSGALSTARQAQQLLRLVMATPGQITSTMSAGCHRLIREREAELMTSANDVIELMSAVGCGLVTEAKPQRRLDELRGLDATVFEALPARGGLSARDLAAKIGVATNLVQASLGRLELFGLVKQKNQKWSVTRDALNIGIS